MEIKTERLILREYTYNDADALAQIISDAETMKHYPKPYDESGVRRWLDWSIENYAKYGFGLWAIELRETGEFIGDCGLTIQNIDGEQLPEIGYHINKRHWRKGFASEAARAVRDWAFMNTEYDSLYSYMTASNVASFSTAAAAGLKRIKEYSDEKGVPHLVYRITREEWENLVK